MNIQEAQADMRHAYLGGSLGLATSAAVWLLAGIVTTIRDPEVGVLVLFVGGMLIHPLAVLATRACGRPGAHAKGNPLGPLAMEGTAILLLGVLLAFILSRFRVELFFPAMLIAIGGRYLTFQTLYGRSIYWLCGAALALLGSAAAWFAWPATVSVFGGAVLEAAFAAVVLVQSRQEQAKV